MQPNMPQQGTPQRSPLAPAYFATLEERLAVLRQEYDQKEHQVEQQNGGNSSDADIFAPELSPRHQAEADQRAQVEEWLAPLTADMTTNSVMGSDVNTDSKEFQHFMDKFSSDPAVQEIQPAAEEFLKNAMALRDQNAITNEQLQQGIINFLDRVAVPLLHKHHSNKKKKRKLIHPDVLNRSQTLTGLGMQNTAVPDGRKARVDMGGE